jgi:HNH endonuclease
MPSRRQRLHIPTKAGTQTTCSYCGRLTNVRLGLTRVHDWQLATIDHILPRALGGDESIQNIRLACMWCNTGRSAAGHCIAALRCAETVLGRGNMALVAKWFTSTQVSTYRVTQDAPAG